MLTHASVTTMLPVIDMARARATVADRALETEIRAFLAEGESATMSHYIAER